jgi:hypothetical protein
VWVNALDRLLGITVVGAAFETGPGIPYRLPFNASRYIMGT